MAQETIFKFKPGCRVKGNAQAVGEALEQIRQDAGGLTAASVVMLSKPKDAPLHNYFDWNDKRAADQFRQHQARHLMASVTVSFRSQDGQTSKPVHAFVAIGEKEDRYLPIMVAMENPDSRRILLAQAIGELAAFQRKYEVLNELAAVFEAIQQTNKAA